MFSKPSTELPSTDGRSSERPVAGGLLNNDSKSSVSPWFSSPQLLADSIECLRRPEPPWGASHFSGRVAASASRIDAIFGTDVLRGRGGLMAARRLARRCGGVGSTADGCVAGDASSTRPRATRSCMGPRTPAARCEESIDTPVASQSMPLPVCAGCHSVELRSPRTAWMPEPTAAGSSASGSNTSWTGTLSNSDWQEPTQETGEEQALGTSSSSSSSSSTYLKENAGAT